MLLATLSYSHVPGAVFAAVTTFGIILFMVYVWMINFGSRSKTKQG